MRCPACDATENRVVDTRASRGGRAVRRRRECTVCGARFTTYEYIEERPIQVLKRSGAVEDFNRTKLLHSVKVACAKRPISASQMDELVDDIEAGIRLDRLGGLQCVTCLRAERIQVDDRHVTAPFFGLPAFPLV